MTKEEIVKSAIENDLVVEVYDILHHVVMAKIDALQDESAELNAELRLVKKFADANNLKVIKTILSESE